MLLTKACKYFINYMHKVKRSGTDNYMLIRNIEYRSQMYLSGIFINVYEILLT